MIKFSYSKELNKAIIFYKKNGFCVLKDIFDSKELDFFFKKVEQIVNEQNLNNNYKIKGNYEKKIIELSKKNDLYRKYLYEALQDLPVVKKYGLNKKIYNIAKKLKIKIPILRTSQIRMDMPKDERFLIPPHQEVKGIRSPNMIFFITALKKITNDMGSLALSPGSFNLGAIQPKVSKNVKYQYIQSSQYHNYPLINFALNKGETILLNMHTIHGSRKNISNHIRWSSIVRIEDALTMKHLINLDDSLIKRFDLKG